jgi:hypothetical protein
LETKEKTVRDKKSYLQRGLGSPVEYSCCKAVLIPEQQ